MLWQKKKLKLKKQQTKYHKQHDRFWKMLERGMQGTKNPFGVIRADANPIDAPSFRKRKKQKQNQNAPSGRAGHCSWNWRRDKNSRLKKRLQKKKKTYKLTGS